MRFRIKGESGTGTSFLPIPASTHSITVCGEKQNALRHQNPQLRYPNLSSASNPECDDMRTVTHPSYRPFPHVVIPKLQRFLITDRRNEHTRPQLQHPKHGIYPYTFSKMFGGESPNITHLPSREEIQSWLIETYSIWSKSGFCNANNDLLWLTALIFPIFGPVVVDTHEGQYV